MALTIDDVRKVNIPINASNKPNNRRDYLSGLAPYNASVNLASAIELFIGSSVATDLSNTPAASNVLVSSSTGADTTIPSATTSLAGVMSATDKVNLNGLGTLSGVALGSLNLGTFTGAIIPDSSTIKAALQALETNVETIPIISKGNLTSTTNAITVGSGTQAVIGSGTTLTIVPANILLTTLGGSLNLSQLSTTGATSGQFISYNGTAWVATTYTPPTPVHNDLTGKQGGSASEYYHIDSALYTKLTNATANRLVGKVSTAGVVEEISLAGSLQFSGTTLQLAGDSASPGNTMYYGTNGSGTKGWYSAVFSGVTSVSVTDTAEIDLTVTNPSTTPSISAQLLNSGVTAGTYGTASAVSVVTVDLKGRITGAVNTSISIPSTSVSDFSEAVDDRVSTLLVAGTGISLTYNDAANTLTIANTLTSSGVTNRVSWWLNNTTLTTDADLMFDGTYLTVGSPSGVSLARVTSKGFGTSQSTYGYIHQSSSGTEVFKVADNGAVTVGALGEVYIHPDAINLATGTDFPISVSGGDLYLYSDVTVVAEGGGSASNTPSFRSIATRSTSVGSLYNAQITGDVAMTVGGTNTFTDLLVDTRVNQTLHTGTIRSVHIKPIITASNNYVGLDIDVPSSETALKVTAGEIRFELPSSATGDLFYRDANGKVQRLGVGLASEVLGSNGTIPVWTTTAGSLPGGSNGDILIYSGGSWISGTPTKEKLTGITGTGFNLAVTPLSNMILLIYKNGVLQDDPEDYSIVGNSVTMITALITSDKITAIYYI